MNESFDLSTAECLELLSAGLVGRVAMCTPLGPHIVPVNYTVVDESVLIRTSPYSVLGSHARGTTLVVEVDQIDYERQTGWSVIARGRAETVTGAEDLNQIRRAWEPHTWVSGQRNLYLRVRWSELTGRRLGPGWAPTEALPVQRAI